MLAMSKIKDVAREDVEEEEVEEVDVVEEEVDAYHFKLFFILFYNFLMNYI